VLEKDVNILLKTSENFAARLMTGLGRRLAQVLGWRWIYQLLQRLQIVFALVLEALLEALLEARFLPLDPAPIALPDQRGSGGEATPGLGVDLIPLLV
jgi:hypothetical protein